MPIKKRPPRLSLLNVQRDLGYSLETAVADLIDNSITAKATAIKILSLRVEGKPVFGIIDNGQGMNPEELENAMILGSRIGAERVSGDLGKFGIGLKSASLSQCRRFTVVTSQKGVRCAEEWNLDLVQEEDDWVTWVYENDQISSLPLIENLKGTGTMVIWRDLDRFFENTADSNNDKLLNEKLDLLDKHLSLVFHRFLTGAKKIRKISISINGHPVKPFDPFCLNNTATQHLEEEVLTIKGSKVKIQPYILPHHSNLSEKEKHFYEDRSNFLSNQGVYIYRANRLMHWGDWFRLISKGESTKLARVQVDFPISLDQYWAIDIKKSIAHPPHLVRERLKLIIGKITGRSTQVHKGRGKKLLEEIKSPIWERIPDRNKITYTLNRNHPLLQKFKNALKENLVKKLDLLLEAIEFSLPVDLIYSDATTDQDKMEQRPRSKEQSLEVLKIMKDNFFKDNNNPEEFRETVLSIGVLKNEIDKFIQKEFKQT